MTKGILGRKLGMTQVFDEAGRAIPVTVIEAGPCLVVNKKTAEHDGYNAIQVGFGDIKEKKLTKPAKGYFEKQKAQPRRHLRELRVTDIDKYQVGQEIKADIFNNGEVVDVIGISRGLGFAGTIRRYGAHRGPMTHGSKYHRRVGSLQSRAAARVFKGRMLPGRLGGDRVTAKNVRIVKVDPERNLILIGGSVPGVTGALVTIKDKV
ncbi:MAG TPA: 50S ribosomal protein L3 [Bacillota bacterium]